METEQVRDSTDVRAERERFVPRGVATTDFVVTRAEGASLWDADGREYLDFAGGIACQNLGHNPEAVVRAVHEQVDRYLHQCFMVGMYEPYVEVARRLDELWPGESATRRRSSSTRAPRRSRTRSRSPARRRSGRASSSSTAPSTAAPT